MALKTLNKLEFKKYVTLKLFLLDSTSILIDLKFNGKYISKQTCLDKNYKRGFLPPKAIYTHTPNDQSTKNLSKCTFTRNIYFPGLQ